MAKGWTLRKARGFYSDSADQVFLGWRLQVLLLLLMSESCADVDYSIRSERYSATMQSGTREFCLVAVALVRWMSQFMVL